ncbi:MAG: gamma-glutamylcyclotransferase [Planctomycetota bacterium]|nr:MAG: gamma-glutamylcyclotransferase [Planctomycetota bacterium]REK27350.1 MAG: gamma-glutamylcyclotransferase [Planctomycetota bacterium]REK36628.1 MAG: gamma-glutamylcyclotransferase [Planctomycetota bacterium]
MTTYFAYGSNMLTARVTRRTPSAVPVGRARLEGFQLCFHKRGMDGSGKCSIAPAADRQACVWGVLFEIPRNEHALLDLAESLGAGYIRKSVVVQRAGSTLPAWTYQAQAGFIDGDLSPFDWYHALVLAGAVEHGLPPGYVEQIEMIASVVDPSPGRTEQMKALLSAPAG